MADKWNLGPDGANFDRNGTHFMHLYVAQIVGPRLEGRLDLRGVDDSVLVEAHLRGLPVARANLPEGQEVDYAALRAPVITKRSSCVEAWHTYDKRTSNV